MTITLRCEAGDQYGIGHAMRLRTIAKTLHAFAPDIPLQVLGATPALDTIFACCQPWAPVYHGVNHYEDDVFVVDLPQYHWDQESAWARNIIQNKCLASLIALDAPWVTPELCDVVILPGLHHSVETLQRLQHDFGDSCYAGAEYAVLPHTTTQRMPYTVRPRRITFSAGGSDPHGVLARLYTYTRPLQTLMPNVQRIYMYGHSSSPWPHETSKAYTYDRVRAFDAEVLLRSSLHISTWGISAYECLAAGTPALVIPQDAPCDADATRAEQATRGALRNMGLLANTTPEAFSQQIARLWADVTTRLSMHRQSAGRIDDEGSTRIAHIILRQIVRQEEGLP